jgi:predicted O-methyltransferase YrrM
MQSFLQDVFKLPIKVGSITQKQANHLRFFLTAHPEIKTVLETGFHIGLSSAVMMDTSPTVELTSFDIFWFDYTSKAKMLLDRSFPDRHMLIAGNSASSLKTFFSRNPSYSPDFVFIDGGHERPIPYLDLHIILSHCRPGTWVMIDDYCKAHGEGGVIEAVNYFIKTNVLEGIQVFEDGDRGWVLGKRSAVEMPASLITEEERIKQLSDVVSHY